MTEHSLNAAKAFSWLLNLVRNVYSSEADIDRSMLLCDIEEGAGRGEVDEALYGVVEIYLNILEKHQGQTTFKKRPLESQLLHSSLIQRLLAGKPPLPNPPPTTFSRPWYGLIENGKGDVLKLHVWEHDPTKVMINQDDNWTVLKRHSSHLYHLEHLHWPGDRWEARKPYNADVTGWDVWRLKKL